MWEKACQADSEGMGWSLTAHGLSLPETFTEGKKGCRPCPVGSSILNVAKKKKIMETSLVMEKSTAHALAKYK